MRTMHMGDAGKVLLEIRQLLNDINIIFFLRHGTCLGAVRDGKLIPWDDDIDIGSIIGLHDLDVRSIYKAADRFKEAGFTVKILPTDFHIGVELSKYEIPVDWTCYKAFKGDIFQYPAVKIPVRLYESLRQTCLLGESFYVPNPAEEYLTLKYGPDWRVPKKLGFEGDIIDSIPEAAVLDKSGVLKKILKFLFPKKYVTRIKILGPDMMPIKMTEITIVGVSRCTTDQEGFAHFNLLNEDYYAVVVGNDDEREILYEEILKPGKNYSYIEDPNERYGRIRVLKETPN